MAEPVYVRGVIATVVADLRASGDTGMVENLLEANRAFDELIEALVDYFGPMDDPSIGWCDPRTSHKDIFKCEKCGAEHRDCSLIPHTRYCRAVRLREAMRVVIPPACSKCGQNDFGQTGEYPCDTCGLPTVHDERVGGAE